jgi:diguanylate cyclase (GGDEF)-like protein
MSFPQPRSVSRRAPTWPFGWLLPQVGIAAALLGSLWLVEMPTAQALHAALVASVAAALLVLGYLLRVPADGREASHATDTLTGLADRQEFERHTQQELERALRHPAPLALLKLDVDHLKTINDCLGQPAGDRILKVVGQCLRESCRTVDFLARWGGDEFVVLAPNTSDCEAALLAGHITAAFRRMSSERHTCGLRREQAKAGHLSVSIGIAVADGPALALPDALFAAADTALLRAKAHGGGQAAYISSTREPQPLAQVSA